MADVFISYKREEKERCAVFRDKLAHLDVPVWFDAKLEIGRPFDEEINYEVRIAKCVLVLWSPLSVRSLWVRNEATIGLEQNKLVSALIEQTDLPAPFRLIHSADLCNFSGQDTHPDWLKVLERIAKLTGRHRLDIFSQLLEKGDVNAAASWAVENYSDPLANKAVPRVAQVLQERTALLISKLRDNANPPKRKRHQADQHAIGREQPEAEEENWKAICDSDDYRDFQDHLTNWPDGRRAAECRKRIVELTSVDE